MLYEAHGQNIEIYKILFELNRKMPLSHDCVRKEKKKKNEWTGPSIVKKREKNIKSSKHTANDRNSEKIYNRINDKKREQIQMLAENRIYKNGQRIDRPQPHSSTFIWLQRHFHLNISKQTEGR